MYTCNVKIYVMKFLKYIKMCMLLNLTRVFEIVQELMLAKGFLQFLVISVLSMKLRLL